MSYAISLKLQQLEARQKSRRRNEKDDHNDEGGKGKKRKTAAGKKNKNNNKKETLAKSIANDCVWSQSQDVTRRFLLGSARRKSCLISGGAGTGKSMLLQYVTRYWGAHSDLRFTSTASIGTAAFSLKGTTFHRFVGVTLPLFECGNIDTIMREMKQYAKSRILSCQLIILDEISIVSRKTFETASHIMQRVRGNYDRPFGGIDLVCCGDFLQLRPNSGQEYAFQSPLWQQLFQAGRNIYILDEQFRQKDDAQFTKMLNHVRSGIVNDEVRLYFQLCELNQHDPDELEMTRHFTYLASKRDMVEVHNKTCHELLRQERPSFPVQVYRRDKRPLEPEEEARIPRYMESTKLEELEKRIPSELELLAGSRVLITENLDLKKGLVNGRQATVVAVTPESVQIILEDGTLESLDAHNWRARDAKYGKWYELSQLPLIRSWGFTIHKSQGQTFANGVLVNALGIPMRGNEFSYGQFYVAASRSKCRNQLAIIGFDPRRIHADPIVLRWYTSLLIENYNLVPNITLRALNTILDYLF